MDDVSKRVGGLIDVAETQQHAVTKATRQLEETTEALKAAQQRLEAVREPLVKACAVAVGVAVSHEAKALAERLEAPFKAPVELLQQAAHTLGRATRTVNWTWLGSAFLVGVTVGFGVAGFLMKQRLDDLLRYSSMTYEQTKPAIAPAKEADTKKPKKQPTG